MLVTVGLQGMGTTVQQNLKMSFLTHRRGPTDGSEQRTSAQTMYIRQFGSFRRQEFQQALWGHTLNLGPDMLRASQHN